MPAGKRKIKPDPPTVKEKIVNTKKARRGDALFAFDFFLNWRLKFYYFGSESPSLILSTWLFFRKVHPEQSYQIE